MRAKLILALALAGGLFGGGEEGLTGNIIFPCHHVVLTAVLFYFQWGEEGWRALSGQHAPFLIMCVLPTPPKTQLEVFFPL